MLAFLDMLNPSLLQCVTIARMNTVLAYELTRNDAEMCHNEANSCLFLHLQQCINGLSGLTEKEIGSLHHMSRNRLNPIVFVSPCPPKGQGPTRGERESCGQGSYP